MDKHRVFSDEACAALTGERSFQDGSGVDCYFCRKGSLRVGLQFCYEGRAIRLYSFVVVWCSSVLGDVRLILCVGWVVRDGKRWFLFDPLIIVQPKNNRDVRLWKQETGVFSHIAMKRPLKKLHAGMFFFF